MLYIVIPVHNRLNLTIECLQSLQKQTLKEIKIIIIDDGSTDETHHYLQTYFPDVIVLTGNGNLWWTGAIKMGVEYALGHGNPNLDYFVTINNDVVLENNTLEILINFLNNQKKPTIVSALSVSKYDKQTVISTGHKMRSWFINSSISPLQNKQLHQLQKKHLLPIQVDMLGGRTTMMPLSIFHQIGNYDTENFPHYAGDYEFTCRAHQNQWQLVILPEAIVYVDQENTGLNSTYKKLSLKEIFESFTSIKSANNLKIRTRFAFKCCPKHAIPTYLFVMIIKIFFQSFILNFLK